MKKKNLTIFLLSSLLSIFILYFLFFLKIYFEGLEKVPYLLKTKETLEFHKKYSQKLHHLRNTHGRWDFGKLPENYLFTSINKFSNDKTNILLQGDSWIEAINLEKESLNLINKFAKKNNIGIINAGVTSFSPSLMKLQYEILEKDFNIRPNIVVAYIDQTDIGDELCRYKNRRVFNDSGKLIGINKENFTRATFDYTRIYNISEIVLSNNSKFKKIFNLTNFFIIYQPKRFINKIDSILTYGWRNRNVSKCLFGDIRKYLIQSNISQIKYFQSRVVDYIELLLSKKYIEKIILVTFPHKNHLLVNQNDESYYTVNVSEAVSNLVTNNNKIVHLDFSKLISENKVIVPNDLFILDDPGSHLKPKYHSNIFTRHIIDLLKD